MSDRFYKILWIPALLSLLSALLTVFFLMPKYDGFIHVPGIWIAQSVDANNGVFYRPILNADGMTGGTRYFPLPIVLLSFLYQLGTPLVIGVYLITTFFLLLFLLGVFLLVKRLGLSWEIALIISLLTLSPEIVIRTWYKGYIDILTSAFNILGLAVLYKSDEKMIKPLHCILGGSFFALAFLSKLTALYGLVTFIIYFWQKNKLKELFYLIVTFISLSLLGLILTEMKSEGRFSLNLYASLTGGANLSSIVSSPIKLFYVYYEHDFSFYILILALAAYLISFKLAKAHFVGITFLITFLMTILIMFSPGTYQNHFIDLSVVSLITATYFFYRENKRLCVTLLFIWGSLAAIRNCYTALNPNKVSFKDTLFEIAENTKEGKGPLLSEHPLIPMLVGEVPYMTDEFMFRHIAKTDRQLERSLLQDLQNEKFRAIIIDGWELPLERWDEKRGYLTEELVKVMKEHYNYVGTIGSYFIFKPKTPL